MKFLVDNALSPYIRDILEENGYDTIHVRDKDMQDASDREIFNYAEQKERVIISGDTDFGAILSRSESDHPSLILFRYDVPRRPEIQGKILIQNLSRIEDSLKQGAIVVFEGNRTRIRDLPF